jgi:hypothetical protein
VNALALLSANRRKLALVIEHSLVRLGGFSRFLFEADAQLRFVTLAQHPLFFFAASSLIGLSRFLFVGPLPLLASGLLRLRCARAQPPRAGAAPLLRYEHGLLRCP